MAHKGEQKTKFTEWGLEKEICVLNLGLEEVKLDEFS
jgi:hypothetical protein